MPLSKLHEIGASHCDLKFENICAYVTSSGQPKFTLIDFGMCFSLKKVSNTESNVTFRGNYMYSSFDHLIKGYASQLDDVTSLAYIAFRFIYGSLPWERAQDVSCDPQYFNSKKFAKMRYLNRAEYRRELI